MVILTLLKASFKHRKSSFVSVFILMIIVSTILTSSLSIANNVTKRVIQANDEIGTGDIVLFIDNERLTDEVQSKLRESKAISRIKVIDSFFSSNTIIKDTKLDTTIYFTPYDSADRQYEVFNDKANAFIDEPKPLSNGEVYLPYGIKKICPCEKGDKISLDLPGKAIEFIVAGFVEDPFIGCDVINIKNLFITKSDLAMILNESTNAVTDASLITPINVVHIFAVDEYKSNIEGFSQIINKESEILDIASSSITRTDAQTYTLELPLIMCGALSLFLIILITVVCLVLSNNISTSIEMEYVNIGILKAHGLSKGKLRFVFFLQYLIPAVLGSLIGLLFAYPLIDLVRPLFTVASCVLVSNDLLLSGNIFVLFVILCFICLFIYLKTYRITKISPVKAISGGLNDIYFSSIIRTPVISKSRLAIGFRLALRQLTSNIEQYLGMCMILTLIIFYLSTCNALLMNFTEDFYNELYGIASTDLCVDYKENIDKQEVIEKEINAISTIIGSFTYDTTEFLINDVPRKIQLLDDMTYLVHFTDGKLAEYDNEILITNFLSKEINKTIGDKINVKYGDISHEFTICGTFDSIRYSGKCFAMNYKAAQILNPQLKPTKIFYIINDKAQSKLINDTINDKYDKLNIQTINPSIQSEGTINIAITILRVIILFIFIVAIFFSVIIIWMVCTKSFLKEKINIGIYKAYGFTSFSLKIQFCFRYLIIALVACGFGVILYTFFGDALNLTTFMILGATQFHAPLTVESYIIPPSLICFFVFLSSYVTMGKINKVSTKELVVE